MGGYVMVLFWLIDIGLFIVLTKRLTRPAKWIRFTGILVGVLGLIQMIIILQG